MLVAIKSFEALAIGGSIFVVSPEAGNSPFEVGGRVLRRREVPDELDDAESLSDDAAVAKHLDDVDEHVLGVVVHLRKLN